MKKILGPIIVLFLVIALVVIGYFTARHFGWFGLGQEKPGEAIVIDSRPTTTPKKEPETPFTGDPRSACPVASTGTNPVTNEPLMLKLDPYGDYRATGVVCEYEVIGQVGGTIVPIPNGMAALIADWVTTCPTGLRCEGVWVATDDFTLPPADLAHVYLYTGIDAAIGRFLGNQTTGEGSFACEYVNGHEGHTTDNIRVPDFWSTWQENDGSIFDHTKVCPAP